MKQLNLFTPKTREISILCISTLLLSMLIFKDFIFGDNLLLYLDTNDDTFQSYLPVYQFVVNKISNHNFSLYDMSYGIGGNILTASFVIFDPFAVIVYIVGLVGGIDKMPLALIYMQITKIVCASLAARYFLKSFSLSFKSIYIASIAYAFSSFFIGNIGQHYMFATAALFAILFIGLAERGRHNLKIIPVFTLCVAVCGIWSIYYCYMVLLPCGIYLLLRWFQEEKLTLKSWIGFFCPWIIAVICGMLVSMVVMLPLIILMLTISDRVNVPDSTLISRIVSSFIILPTEQYKSLFLSMFSNQLQGSTNNWEGAEIAFKSSMLYCSIIAPISFFCIIKNILFEKKSRKKLVTIIFITLCVLFCGTKIAGNAFNAFAGYTTRYMFVLLIILAYSVAKYVEVIFDSERKNVVFDITLILLFCIIIIKESIFGQAISKYSAINVLISLTVILFIILFARYKIANVKLLYAIFGGCILISIYIDSTLFTQYDRAIISKDWYSDNYKDKAMNYATRKYKGTEDQFWRMERNFYGWGIQPMFTYANIEGYRGVSFYNSVINENLQDFRKEMLNINNPGIAAGYSSNQMGQAFDNTIADIYGLKYVVSDYVTNDPNWELMEEYLGKYIYRNKSVSTAGILFDSWYAEEDFGELSAIEKQALLSQSVIISKEDKISLNKNSTVKGIYEINEIDLNSVTIETGEVTPAENGFVLNNKDGGNSVAVWSIKDKSFDQDTKQIWLNLKVKAEGAGNLTIYLDTGNGFNPVYWAQKSTELWKGYETEITMQIPADLRNVKFDFIGSGTIMLDSIKLYGNDVSEYINEGLILTNPNKQGIINGTVNCDKDQILLVPVCYENGWKAQIDGEDAKILKGDFAFMALIVPAGEHEVSFIYETPGLKLGLCLSVIGILLSAIYFIYCYKIIKKIAKREE